MKNVRIGGARWAGVAVVVAAVAACSSGGVDKQGASTAPAVRTLRIGMPDGGDPGGAVFVKAITERSKGRITVTVDSETYASRDPQNEVKLVADLKAGTVDGGYMPSRDWSADGVPSFQVVQTPFLLSTVEAEVQLAQSPVAATVLAGLRSHGVEGLALVPNEVRQLLTRKPWLDGGDLRGAKMRIIDNPQTAAMIWQLGGTPTQGYTSDEVEEALKTGELDGVESAPSSFAPQSYHHHAPFVTGFGVLPKFQVAVIANGVRKGLSEHDRDILHAAAGDALAEAAGNAATMTTRGLVQACQDGAVIVQPSPASLTALAARITPVTTDERLLSQLREAVPLAGPRLMTVPNSCRVATTDQQARSLIAQSEAKPMTSSTQPASKGRFPVGTYTTSITTKDFHKKGVNGAAASPITITGTFGADGSYREEFSPADPEADDVIGRYAVDGDKITVTWHSVE